MASSSIDLRSYVLIGWLTNLWRSLKKECMIRVRSLLSMRCLLLGYSFDLRPNSHALGTAAVVLTIGLTITAARTRKTSWIRKKQDWLVQKFGLRRLQKLDTFQEEPTFNLLDQEEDKRKLCTQGASYASFSLPAELTRRHNDTRF